MRRFDALLSPAVGEPVFEQGHELGGGVLPVVELLGEADEPGEILLARELGLAEPFGRFLQEALRLGQPAHFRRDLGRGGAAERRQQPAGGRPLEEGAGADAVRNAGGG